MKQNLVIAVAISALGLAGCVAVPAYSEPYGYGYGYGGPVAVAPPAVVVQPTFYGRYYYGRRHYYYR